MSLGDNNVFVILTSVLHQKLIELWQINTNRQNLH